MHCADNFGSNAGFCNNDKDYNDDDKRNGNDYGLAYWTCFSTYLEEGLF